MDTNYIESTTVAIITEKLRTSSLRKLRKKNMEKLQAINSSMPANTREYEAAMQEHYKEALKEFWIVLRPRENTIALSGVKRWFNENRPKKRACVGSSANDRKPLVVTEITI